MKFGLGQSDSSSDDDDRPLPTANGQSPLASSSRLGSPLARAVSSRDSGDEPFNPTPVHLVRPPNLKRAERRRRRPHAYFNPDGDAASTTTGRGAQRVDGSVLSLSSGSEDDSQVDDDDDDDEEDESRLLDESDTSELDSEEEAWPVGPVNSIGVRGWRRSPGVFPPSAAARKGKMRAYEADSGTRLYGGPDELDDWDAKARASSWAAANRTFHLSLARSHAASGSRSGAVAAAAPSKSPPPPDLDAVQSLLGRLALQQSQETAQLVDAFEKRNRALWDSVEASIRQAEHEEGERQRALAEQRRKEEEAKRKAQELRDAEEKRAEEERKRNEEERKREEEEAEGRRKREEEERARKAEEEQKLAAKASALGLPGPDAEGSPQAEFERWTAKMTHIKQSVLPVVSQNPAWRKACFQAKRSITPKIGQLTSSAEAISRIIRQLDELLSSMKPPADGSSTTTPPEPYIWTLNHLAKALVKQAETEVTAKLGTAYPLGRVVIGLLTRGHTELGEVLMARLVKKCFWITGHWPKKTAEQTDEAHQKVLGHAPPTAGETLVQYAERMSGLVALYASILQTSPLDAPQGPCSDSALAHVPAHFRPAAGWRWLVLMLRPPLVALEPTPLLLVTFLEIAGPGLGEVYGRQFGKYLEVLLREGMREGRAGFSDKAKSSTVRLLLWLEDWEKKGVIEGASGRAVDA
ncbi:hypothetical protein JCM8202_005469 [Rhodotorula sphaerocarpa]